MENSVVKFPTPTEVDKQFLELEKQKKQIELQKKLIKKLSNPKK